MGFIYKIYCKDSNIKDFYIGKATDIKTRIAHHKHICIYNKSESYVYKFINENGGWINWDYEIIQEVTNTKFNLGDIENEYLLIYKPTLNTSKPKENFNMTKAEYFKDYKIKQGRMMCNCGKEFSKLQLPRHKKICYLYN
mgnify:FL=1